jgi:ABC-type polysaccharide/polyol phosphate export systems, permease component
MQMRVLWALCLREMHGKHGKSKLGYFWVLFKTFFGITIFWFIREKAGFTTPHAMPLPLYLLLGFIPWYIFSNGLRMVMEAVKTNRALLTFPHVSPLDLYLSSGLVTWVTEVVVFGLFLLVISLMGYSYKLHDPITLFTMLVMLGFFAFGLGLVLSALSLYLPVIERVVPVVLRIMFFTSGIFYSPSQLTARFSSYIYWNPLVNYIEACRAAFCVRTPFPEIKMTYITCLTFILLALGLLVERYVRTKQNI